MNQDHRILIGIKNENKIIETGTKREQRKGMDTDIYFYDEINQFGEMVAKYEVRESMSIYPPQTINKSFKKLKN